jgi:uncharacterized protein (DUF1684 family)
MMNWRAILPVFLASATLFAASSSPDAAYRASFEKWKSELIDDLKQNWLPLAGLFWLKPGPNSFGTDKTNDIVLPAGSAPARAGSFELQGETVTVKLARGVQGTIDGKPATTSAMQPDTSSNRTILALGHLRMHVIKRGERTGIRLKDLNSAAVREFRGLTFFALDLRYRVNAQWVPSDGKKTVNVPNVLGDVTPTPIPGEVRFTLNGQEFHLTALGGDAQKGLFFVFTDGTSTTDTYPAGRFLETDPVQGNTVVLDFNEAYNPPCAVTPYATCPIAPKENRLTVAIPAGEKYDRTHAHH